jgi:hypothetical protein
MHRLQGRAHKNPGSSCVQVGQLLRLTRARRSFLLSENVYRFPVMYIGHLRPRMPRWFSSKGSVTASIRRIQVWGVNRKVRTGKKRLRNEGLERALERDALQRFKYQALELILTNRVVAL